MEGRRAEEDGDVKKEKCRGERREEVGPESDEGAKKRNEGENKEVLKGERREEEK